MNEDEIQMKLDQLAQQQAYQTNAIRAALEARWSGGADTVDGWVKALDPRHRDEPADAAVLDAARSTSASASYPSSRAAITQRAGCMGDGRWTAAQAGADSVEGWLLALNPTWTGSSCRGRRCTPCPTRRWACPRTSSGSAVPTTTTVAAGWGVAAIVIHTMAGTLEAATPGSESRQSQVSSHYGIGLAGEIHQYVNLWDGSWANGVLEPGNEWQHIVGNSSTPTIRQSRSRRRTTVRATAVTEEQYQGTLAACRLAMQQYPQVCYLFGHRIISPEQSGRTAVATAGGRAGSFQRLADELDLEAHF